MMLCSDFSKASLWGLVLHPRPRCGELKGLAVGSLEMVAVWFGMEMC